MPHPFSLGRRLVRFTGSLVGLAIVAVVVPATLVWLARSRFGGPSPLAGYRLPTSLDIGRAVDTSGELTDIMVRGALLIGWACVLVLVATIVNEVWFQWRHGMPSTPRHRSFGLGGLARVIAAGLVVLLPVSQSGVTLARGLDVGARPAPVTAVAGMPSASSPARQATPVARAEDSMAAPTAVTVQPGDSVWSIAERLSPGDPAPLADAIVEANLGTQMVDGQWFVTPALIQPGWRLVVPGAEVVRSAGSAPLAMPDVVESLPASGVDSGTSSAAHVVSAGDSYWGIAEQVVGDESPHLVWDATQDLMDANAPRLAYADPAMLHPGDVVYVDVIDPALAPVVDVPDAPDEPVDVTDDVPVPPPSVPTTSTPVTTAPVTTTSTPVTSAPVTSPADTLPPPPVGAVQSPDDGSDLTTGIAGAVLLAGGALGLLASRRRAQLRRARVGARLAAPLPFEQHTEQQLRLASQRLGQPVVDDDVAPAVEVDPAGPLTRLDLALRAAAAEAAPRGRSIVAAVAGGRGDVLVLLDEVLDDTHWQRRPLESDVLQVDVPSGGLWLAADVPLAAVAAEAVGHPHPCPALVHLGRTDDGELFVDLEAVGDLHLRVPRLATMRIVRHVAATLSLSPFAQATTVATVGLNDELLRMSGHVRPVESAADALAMIARAEMTGDREHTQSLRQRAIGGEAWAPTIAVVADAGTAAPAVRAGRGVALVRGGGEPVSTWWVEASGGRCVLQPLGVTFDAVGVDADDLLGIADLLQSATLELPVVLALPPDPVGVMSRAAETVTVPVVDLLTAPDDSLIDDRADVGAADHDAVVALASGGSTGAVSEGIAPITVGAVADDVAMSRPLFVEQPWSLLVRVFGDVCVIDTDGQPAVFERAKALELVVWLTQHRRLATRGGARAALWTTDVRDATFANVVSDARRSLARLVPPPDGDEWVGRTLTDELPVHPLVVCDADLIEARLRAAQAASGDDAIEVLRPAVDLIVGMPFAGTNYLWPDNEGVSSSMLLLATSAATRLAEVYLDEGDIDGVFWATRQGLSVLPGHEELIGLRMRALAAAGDLSGVRAEWDTYERGLAADPWADAEPAPKLVALRRALLSPAAVG